MSEKDFHLAKAMASVSPEKREQLQARRDQERIALLEDVLAMTKE